MGCDAVIERLTAARLLVVGDDSAEIAHEALIREWPRLRGWLAEDREELRTLRQLTTAARSWDENGRDDADLYRGPRLAAAVELAGDERQLSRVEREFLDASQDAQARELRSARRRARRLRALLAGRRGGVGGRRWSRDPSRSCNGDARATRRPSPRPDASPPSRARSRRSIPTSGSCSRSRPSRLDDSVDTRGALLGALEHGSRIRTWLQGFDSPVDVGLRILHVAGARRRVHRLDVGADQLAHGAKQLIERDPAAGRDVDHFARSRSRRLARAQHAVDDVGDVGEVARLLAVAVDRRLAAVAAAR